MAVIILKLKAKNTNLALAAVSTFNTKIGKMNQQ